MPKQKVLSANDILKILSIYGFTVKSQKGSHIKLVRLNNDISEILVIPNHKVLDKGTQNSIYRQATKFINASELEPYFFNL